MKHVLVIMVIGILLAGCGSDTINIPEDTFFNDYFGDCVTMCQQDNKWLTQCPDVLEDQPLPDVMDCVRILWDCGKVSNATCYKETIKIQNNLKTQNCNEWIDDAMTGGGERSNGIPYNCLGD